MYKCVLISNYINMYMCINMCYRLNEWVCYYVHDDYCLCVCMIKCINVEAYVYVYKY